MKFYKYIDTIPAAPSEGSFEPGDEIKVRKGLGTESSPYYWNLYKVAANGSIDFVRGITDDQNTRLERMSSDQISKVESITTGDITKLKEDYTKAEIDQQFNDVRNFANSSRINLNGSTVLPVPPRRPDNTVIEDAWVRLAQNVTYTQAGGDPLTGIDGHETIAEWNNEDGEWTLVDMGELATNPLTNIVDQSTNKGITPKGVDDAIGEIRVPTSQLLDKSTFVFGFYGNTGLENNSSNTIRTPKIQIASGQTKLSISNAYVLGSSLEYRVFFYGSNGIMLSTGGRIASSVIDLSNLDIPSEAVSWAMNVVTEVGLPSPSDNQYSNGLMANYGATVKPYENFGFNIVGSNIKSLEDDIKNNTDTINKVITNSINLIDKTKISYGYWNDSGGRTSSTTTISSEKIPVEYIEEEQEYISLNQSNALGISHRFVFWDKNGALISIFGADQPIQGVPLPINVGSVGVNIISRAGGVGDATNNQWVNSLQLEYGLTSTPYQMFGEKIKTSALPNINSNGVEIEIQSANAFIVTSFHDNGEKVEHHWVKNNKVPQYDDAWRASEIYHLGRNIAQGSFNFIHMLAFPNEGQHVGTGHGCETLIRADFYVDGKKFVPADSVGEKITGSVFHFDIASVIYAADSAETTANWNGSNVVPQLPLIESTFHYMIGSIVSNSRTTNYNKLVFNRDGSIPIRCYLMMHSGYPTYFDRVEVGNIENTMNNYNQEPIEGSTAVLNGATYDTAEGYRGELAQRVISYSDRFNYVMKTEAFASKESQREKANILVSKNSQPDALKFYFQPVVTTEVANARGIPIDVFNKGDILEGTVYRELHV